jgi:1-deoxy-D-xylulose-5-phosphate synthase
LDFWGSINLEETRTISERLDPLLTGGGRRLVHLYGHAQTTVASPAHQEATLISPTDSLEAAFLQNLPSLLSDSIQLIWSLPQTPPGSLQGLLCQPEHLAAAAFGVAQAGLFPVLALSAGQIGQALPGLLEGLPPGCLLLLLEAGLVWEAGQSHLAPSRLRDLALLRQIHGLALTCPSDLEEALQIVQLSYQTETPIALRLSQAPAVHASMASTPMAAGCAHCLRQGKNVAILALGPIVYAALLAAESLASWGVECQVWDVRFVKPLDRDALTQASQCGFILTVEEHCLQGGLATTVLETLSQLKEYPRVEHLALPASPPIQRGTNLEEMALDADGIQRAVRQLLGLASHLMGAS